MITFAIKDKHHRRRPAEAWLFYDENTRKFSIEVEKTADPERLPLILSILFKQKITRIDDYWSRKFVKERIVPSERQNIGAILKASGLPEYSEIDLLKISKGQCSQDDFYLEEVPQKDGSFNVGLLILQERQKQHISQAKLAEKCSIKQSNLSRIENGVCEPSISTLNCIAKGLGLSLNISFE